MRIFIRITFFVVILVSGYMIFIAIQHKKIRDDLKSQLEEKTKENAGLNATITDKNKEIEAKKKAIKDAEQKALQSAQETENVRKDLEGQKSQLADTQSKLQQVTKDLGAKQTQIDGFMKALPEGMTLDNIKSELKKLQDQSATLDQEKKLLSDSITAKEAKIKDLEDKLHKRENKMMPSGLTGHVLAINNDWNFVVLDIGADQGVVEEATMIVYREANLVGKIKITSVEPSISIGDIIPEWKKDAIKEGDSVVY